MNWFFIALIAPALWSITNHIDKYLVNKYVKNGGIGALMIFSSLIGFFTLPFILIFSPNVLHVGIPVAILIIANGWIYLLATLFYLYALNRGEVSMVVPLFQMVPVFSYFLGFVFLRETLLTQQIAGGCLIVFGAIFMSLELRAGEKIKFKKNLFWLMALSSFLYAINILLFKYFAFKNDFWTTSFWEYVGFFTFAVFLFFIKSYRKQFSYLINNNKLAVVGLNGFNEVINLLGKISFNFASLLAPITLVSLVNGFQPLFVFVGGVALTLFFPKISQENIAKRHLFHKMIAISIILIGAYLLN